MLKGKNKISRNRKSKRVKRSSRMVGNKQKKNRAEIEDELAIIEAIKEAKNSERIRIKEKYEDHEKIRKNKIKGEKETSKVETMKKLFEKNEIVLEKKENKVKFISKMIEEMGGNKKTPGIPKFQKIPKF